MTTTAYHEVEVWPLADTEHRIHLQIIGEEIRGVTLCGLPVKGFAPADRHTTMHGCPECYRARRRAAATGEQGES
jgi:hypothetical protein